MHFISIFDTLFFHTFYRSGLTFWFPFPSILGALGSLLAYFFRYFSRPCLKIRKYWKNEAQTPPRRNPPASGRTPTRCPLPPRTPPSLAYATLSQHNVQAWRVQALPVIHFWVSLGIIFKYFLANFPRSRNSSNNQNL